MASRQEKEDFSEFLKKIDELESVLKGNVPEKENSCNEQNRTVINKNAFKDEHSKKMEDTDSMTMDKESFLISLEADAAARTQRRKEKTKLATKLKEDGNKAFKEANYEEAIKLYSEGLNHLKDMVVLYTNRAQAYNRISRFEEAMKDCDTALLLDEGCTKAFIHKGKSLVALKRYEEAVQCYQEILKHKPNQEKIVEEYVQSAIQAQKAAESEAKAAQLFLEGSAHATNVVQVLEKLRREGKPTVYYGGGLGVLADMLRDDTSRTLFRSHDGWKVFSENRTISRLLVALLTFVQTLETGSAEAAKLLNNLALEKKFVNQFREKFESEVLPAIVKLMANTSSVTPTVLPSCFSFMGNMAHDAYIRKKMCESMDFWEAAAELLKSLGAELNSTRSQDILYALLGLLVNVAMETTESLVDQSGVILTYTIMLLETTNDITERALGLISRVLPQSEESIFVAGRQGLAQKAMMYMKGSNEAHVKPAIKILAVLSQSDEDCRKVIVEQDKGFEHLQRLLHKSDDIIIANTALCMSHCVTIPGASQMLVGSDIIKALLTKTHTSNGTVKQNCAITLAKLATSDERHLERLRELGGIGILHSCMKHVK